MYTPKWITTLQFAKKILEKAGEKSIKLAEIEKDKNLQITKLFEKKEVEKENIIINN